MTKFEDTVKEMESQVEELENDLAEKAEHMDEQSKEKAQALVNKTEDAIKSSIEKVKGIINEVQEDEKLDEFLDKVKAKSKEAVDFTKEKVNELTDSSTESGKKLEQLGNEIAAEFDKIKDSETFKKTADFLNDISNKVTDYFNKPEVQNAIDKAKTTTISIAEKGVDNLKKALEPKKAEETEEPVEDCGCEAAPAEEEKPEE